MPLPNPHPAGRHQPTSGPSSGLDLSAMAGTVQRYFAEGIDLEDLQRSVQESPCLLCESQRLIPIPGVRTYPVLLCGLHRRGRSGPADSQDVHVPVSRKKFTAFHGSARSLRPILPPDPQEGISGHQSGQTHPPDAPESKATNHSPNPGPDTWQLDAIFET